MKLVKKWLFPALTCLIVAGAAVLPQHISNARDARQFWPEHIEPLEADALPVYEPPSLGDRMALYAHRLSKDHPVLSFEDPFYFEQHPQEKAELTQSMEALLTEAGVIPEWVFREDPFTDLTIKRFLLWDPAGDKAAQEPTTFYSLRWENHDKLHNKLLRADVDAESGLPVYLMIFDTNMSQWLPYQVEPLQALAGRFFDLLGMDAQELGTGGSEIWHAFEYELTGTQVHYNATRQPTSVTIEPDLNWYKASTSGATDRYDG